MYSLAAQTLIISPSNTEGRAMANLGRLPKGGHGVLGCGVALGPMHLRRNLNSPSTRGDDIAERVISSGVMSAGGRESADPDKLILISGL